MGAIGLNPIRLDAIGLDPIRFNAIRLGVPGASSATDRPYISPDVLSSLAGVWIADGKRNTDPDRNIIKNKLLGRGGDFELLNFAYKLNSGYGKYEEDFTAWGRDASELLDVRPDKVIISDVGGINSYRMIIWKGNTHTKAFKAKVTGIPRNGRLIYSYAQNEGDALTNISIDNDGVYEFPYSYGFTNGHGFLIDSGTELEDWIGCTIEFIPSLQGSLCTDGVNDMIVSQNTVEEMGITDEFTVVSMIHQITLIGATAAALTNYIRQPIGYEYVRNHVANIGKTGIYGYAVYDVNHSNTNNSHVINTILGDKNDYSIHITGNLSQGKFSVQGYINSDNNIVELSQVAWYWTFIAKRVLTTDEINQVIAYYNLDKYVMPDIYYDVKKQGLTNDNHAQFGDKLIDYSGNSRDLQLFNIGWNLGSGIGKYAEDFSTMKDYGTKGIVRTSSKIYLDKSFDYDKGFWLCYTNSPSPAYKVRVSGIPETGMLTYTGDVWVNLVNGINELPARTNTEENHGFVAQTPNVDWSKLVIEQIPDFAGALCFDGVDDFGQFVGDLGLKDYTVVFDRAYPIVTVPQFSVISDATGENANTPFLLEHINEGEFAYSYSANTAISINKEREICYQSTYQYKDTVINKGSSTSLGTGLTIARYGINNGYSALALYSFMLFHYSMSKFLIERQLKKHKLGTLYPGMVEFRPIVKSNIPYSSISYSVNPGEYVIEGSTVTITITLSNSSDKLVDISSNAISDISISGDNGVYEVTGKVTKSPQKINIVISSYLTMLDNETLISNETLIKNE